MAGGIWVELGIGCGLVTRDRPPRRMTRRVVQPDGGPAAAQEPAFRWHGLDSALGQRTLRRTPRLAASRPQHVPPPQRWCLVPLPSLTHLQYPALRVPLPPPSPTAPAAHPCGALPHGGGPAPPLLFAHRALCPPLWPSPAQRGPPRPPSPAAPSADPCGAFPHGGCPPRLIPFCPFPRSRWRPPPNPCWPAA